MSKKAYTGDENDFTTPDGKRYVADGRGLGCHFNDGTKCGFFCDYKCTKPPTLPSCYGDERKVREGVRFRLVPSTSTKAKPIKLNVCVVKVNGQHAAKWSVGNQTFTVATGTREHCRFVARMLRKALNKFVEEVKL